MEMEPVRIFQQDGETHLVFDTQLSAAQARALYAQLGQVLTPSLRLVLDAGLVEQVDTAAMQLVAGFCRHVREQGMPLRWQTISPAVREASHLLGLDSLIGRPA